MPILKGVLALIMAVICSSIILVWHLSWQEKTLKEQTWASHFGIFPISFKSFCNHTKVSLWISKNFSLRINALTAVITEKTIQFRPWIANNYSTNIKDPQWLGSGRYSFLICPGSETIFTLIGARLELAKAITIREHFGKNSNK